MPRLTLRLIASTPCPATGETWLGDSTLPGFGVRLRPTHKTYCVRYRTATGIPRRKTLGLTTMLQLEEARELARDLLVAVRQGKDPAAERQATRQAPTIVELATRYLNEHATPHKKPSSVRGDRRNLRVYILPALGKLLVHTITRADVAALHQGMRVTPTNANRCLALLGHMMSLAERWELRAQGSNPVRGVPRYRERKKEHFLSGDELARLGAALAQAEAQRTEHPSALACIRLLLLTGARLGEILGLKWDYIDIERGVARLPDSKTGPKVLRLSAPALAILQALPRTSPWVLPGKIAGKHLAGPWRPWYRLCAAAGITGTRLHDLRHTYASHSAMSGLSLPMIGQLLGHTNTATTQRYVSWAHDPVHAASEQAGEALATMLGQKA